MRRRVFLLSLGVLSWPGTALAAEPHSVYALQALLDDSASSTSLLRAAAGRRLIVVVMKGTWCPVCVAQTRRLESLRARLQSLGTAIVAVTTDGAEDIRRTRIRAALSAPLLSDPERKVVGGLGLWSAGRGHPMPAMIVFDRCGAERWRREGRGPGDRPEAALLAVLERIASKPERCDSAAVAAHWPPGHPDRS